MESKEDMAITLGMIVAVGYWITWKAFKFIFRGEYK